MPVVDLRRGHVPVVEPLLELAGTTDAVRRKARQQSARLGDEFIVNAELGRGGKQRGDEVAHDLSVHRRTGAHGSAERVNVLGRERWIGHKPVRPGQRHQNVEDEAGRASDERMEAAHQPLGTAAELGVVPELDAEPGAAGRPQAPLRAVDRPDRAPEIGVVVQHPAARPVVRRGHLGAGRAHLFDEADQRLHALAEVGGIGQPVVHLEIDVGRVLAAPRRIDLVVPDALEVRRLRAGAGRTDHQVPPVLDVERGERRIGRLRIGGDALVGRQVGVAAPAEIDAQAVEQALVLGDMTGPDLQPRLLGHTRRARRQGGVGIAAGIVEGAEAGGCVDDDERLVGALYP